LTAPNLPWLAPPADLILPQDEVHIWRADLELPALNVQQLHTLLAPDESSRADRFHFAKDRRHFIVGRGVLRTILGRYLGLDPAQLCFYYSDYNKPFLAPESNTEDLCFNLSHSGGLALFAITRGRAVGIDLEHMRANFDYEEVAEHVFSPREVSVLQAIPAEMKLQAFFNCWTRKEAYIKAQGEGLSLPLESFDVSLGPGEPARLLATRHAPEQAARWALHELAPGSGYVGALAVEGQDCHLQFWQWETAIP